MIFGHPLDTVRVRMQQPGGARLGGMTAVWRSMVKGEGTRSLFQGMSGPLATAAFQNAVSFQSYGARSGVLGRRGPPVVRASPAVQPLTAQGCLHRAMQQKR